MRIDKFLKVSRILKRRTLAQQACEKGKVIVNGKDVKPAHQLIWQFIKHSSSPEM